MSKMTKKVIENRTAEVNAVPANACENFMGGISYVLNPLETLKMVSASSIFGEPQYYRNGEFAERGIHDGKFVVDYLFKDYSVVDERYNGMKTSAVMERLIDASLSYDFGATLDWAVELRKNFYMRLNPQVIMVRAAIHPDREKFTSANPGKFAKINAEVMFRADEPATQLTYYLYKNGSKNSVPNLLKRSWAKRIESMSDYDVYKYRNKGIGIIDTVRICHAHGPVVDKLMQTGTVDVEENNKTWEALRASGKSWKEILETINMGHMALLRNLRGIFTEIDDIETCKKVLETLKKGVLKGKQYPFRYYSAMNAVKNANDMHHKAMVLTALEECMDIACDNMPKLKGKTMCLSDNSGSAWGAINSEYGSVTIAEIDNLSSVIAARNSEDGYVGKFGDQLHTIPVNARNGVLNQTNDISKNYRVGGATENGIWLFFDKAIREKEHWDNIFIYSDQQAGHGGLYGINPHDYSKFAVRSGRYIDVAKLINVYRKTVNPKVNVYSVQTAGYDNVLIPENGYRTTILYGWTGKELVYADAMNKFWDEIDSKK